MKSFAGQDILTLKGLERSDFELIFDIAGQMESIARDRTRDTLLSDKLMASVFFQASTRTRLSFESAMLRLGGAVLGFGDPKMTRAGDFFKESISDTAHMIENYADVMVIRHPREGAALEAANAIGIPVLNGGDGYNEHPTQALLDAFTLLREKGTIDGLKIALVGDMNIRVMHSLGLALAQYETEVYLISPEEVALSPEWREQFVKAGLNFEEREAFGDLIEDVDVIYVIDTIMPSFHAASVDAPEEELLTPPEYVIDRARLSKAKPGCIVLHPLPRRDELPADIDGLGRARYFKQSFYGVVLRMALLALVLGRAP